MRVDLMIYFAFLKSSLRNLSEILINLKPIDGSILLNLEENLIIFNNINNFIID